MTPAYPFDPATAPEVGPVTLEVLLNAFTSVAAEMDVTIWRTSRSTIVREMLDYSTAVFDLNGYNIAQSARIPGHLNSMSAALRVVVGEFMDIDDWDDGDVVITNDPYCGGQHIPDIIAFRPVVVDGKRVAIVGTLCHHLDMGGMAAGSYAATATEVFQEGLRIPPLKLLRKGQMNEDVLAMMKQNVRRPDMLMGDLQAQLASLHVGEVGMQGLVKRFGADTIVGASQQLLDGSEKAMRAMIGRIPDGHYSFEDFLDDDGILPDPIRIHTAIEVKGDEMIVDLSGCGKQAQGPVNATPASSVSAVYYAVMAISDKPFAANAGCYRPIKVIVPEGLIVNPRHPAPVANRVAVGHRLATNVFAALHQAVPGRVPAAYYGVSYVCSFQTIGDEGERGVLVEIEVGGTGAYEDQDGLSAWAFGMHNNASIPIEMIEADVPLTITGYGLVDGSGGAGKHRGGLGLFRQWRIDSADAVFTANLERFKYQPYGLEGGEPGRAGRLYLIRNGETTALGSKVNNLPLKRGDEIRLETSGGGGYGAPAERTAADLELDRLCHYA